MPRPAVISHDISIVFIGDLNPKIFQPAWFALYDLLRPSEAESAQIKIIHPDIVEFALDWLTLQVTRERFTARTSQEPYSKHLYDLVLGTFRKLSHTPLTKLGINRSVTYQFNNIDDWHALGHLLTPKEIWSKFLKQPGMRSLTIEGLREDDYKGAILVTIEPTNTVPHGADFKINDHYEAKVIDKVIGVEEMIRILEERYFRSQENSQSLIDKILDEYESART